MTKNVSSCKSSTITSMSHRLATHNVIEDGRTLWPRVRHTHTDDGTERDSTNERTNELYQMLFRSLSSLSSKARSLAFPQGNSMCFKWQ